MPADTGDKTEAPTPRRLQEARERGQVAKSMDLSAAIGLFAGMRESFRLDELPSDGRLALAVALGTFMRHAAGLLLPFLLVLAIVAIVVNVAQVGFIFSAHSLEPSLGKLSPIKGLGRLVSKRTAVRFAMSMAKVAIIALVAYYTVKAFLPRLLTLPGLNFVEVIGLGAHLMFLLGLRLAGVLLVLAIIDYAYQKYQMLQDLRMTKEEVREELKRMEGDPTMRQRRRQVARQLAAQRMSQAVPKADVVVTNPTELAIALKYDHENMAAPKVVAKGAGYIAQRIRELANENGVPIVERKPLARALFKACDIGDYVPADLYRAVAEVLAYVFELAGKGYRRRATG